MFSSTAAKDVEGSGSQLKGSTLYSDNGGVDTNITEASSTGVGLSVGGLVDSIVTGEGGGNNSLNIGHTCGRRSRNSGGLFQLRQQSSESPNSHYHNQSTQKQQTTPTNVIPLGPLEHIFKRQDSNPFYSATAPGVQYYGANPRTDSHGLHQRPIHRDSSFTDGADTTYFINPDGVMETVTTDQAAAATEAYGSHEQALASANCLPPPVQDTRLPQVSSRLNSKITYLLNPQNCNLCSNNLLLIDKY